jgi:hypothetical protein
MENQEKSFAEQIEKHTASRPIAQQVKEWLPAIECALSKGYRHKQIHAWLAAEGIVITFDYYERLITRLRASGRRQRKAQLTVERVGLPHPDQGRELSNSVRFSAPLDGTPQDSGSIISVHTEPSGFHRKNDLSDPTEAENPKAFAWNPKEQVDLKNF